MISNQSIYFTPEHHEFRRQVQEFIRTNISPFLDEWEQNREIPRKIWLLMGKAGLLGLHYNKNLGGTQKDFFYSVVLLEELGRTGSIGFRTAIGVHAYMATAYLELIGSQFLKDKYLIPTISGEKICSLAMTEELSGTDLNSIQTNAILDGNEYIINGTKKYVVNSTVSDFLIVVVKTVRTLANLQTVGGFSLLVVDTNLAGISIKKIENMGMHCSNVAQITFENVRVPQNNLIGKVNQGLLYMGKCLQFERLVCSIMALGGIECCLEITANYMSQRNVYGGMLNSINVLRHKMADFLTELHATKQLVYNAAYLYENFELPILECSMAKLKTTELASQIVTECIQLHGAQGYSGNSLISRMYRDVPIPIMTAGANSIMREIITKTALDDNSWRIYD